MNVNVKRKTTTSSRADCELWNHWF